jgi:hypothetical protein
MYFRVFRVLRWYCTVFRHGVIQTRAMEIWKVIWEVEMDGEEGKKRAGGRWL